MQYSRHSEISWLRIRDLCDSRDEVAIIIEQESPVAGDDAGFDLVLSEPRYLQLVHRVPGSPPRRSCPGLRHIPGLVSEG